MAKTPGARPTAQKPKTPVAKAAAATPTVVAAPAAAAADTPVKKRISPAQFFREVRAEARKVTWTSRKETWITSVMVLIMVVTASLFLFVVDLVLRFGIGAIIKLGS
jgi:preprotein translocase subunit SecE